MLIFLLTLLAIFFPVAVWFPSMALLVALVLALYGAEVSLGFVGITFALLFIIAIPTASFLAGNILDVFLGINDRTKGKGILSLALPVLSGAFIFGDPGALDEFLRLMTKLEGGGIVYSVAAFSTVLSRIWLVASAVAVVYMFLALVAELPFVWLTNAGRVRTKVPFVAIRQMIVVGFLAFSFHLVSSFIATELSTDQTIEAIIGG